MGGVNCRMWMFFLCLLFPQVRAAHFNVSPTPASPQHAFYVSITEIRHDAESGDLRVTIKIFTNDLEAALRNDGAPPDYRLLPGAGEEKFLAPYLLKKLRIQVNGKTLPLYYSGMQQTEDATWSSLLAEGACEVQQLTVKNELLLEVIESQSNIVRVNLHGKQYNYTLDKWIREEVFEIE